MLSLGQRAQSQGRGSDFARHGGTRAQIRRFCKLSQSKRLYSFCRRPSRSRYDEHEAIFKRRQGLPQGQHLFRHRQRRVRNHKNAQRQIQSPRVLSRTQLRQHGGATLYRGM